ncbi:MAG: LytR C-terminal domain-containing protein [Candidatus Shapirobacteria bacterium]
MFVSKKLVIYFSDDELRAGWVVLGKEPRLEGVLVYDREKAKLEKILERVKEDFKYEKAWVVFSDSLSYILRFDVPEGEKRLKKYVKEKISEGIPEILESEYWDFQEVANDQGARKIEVFAPVKEALDQFKKAAKKTDLEIMTVEPELLSKSRNSEPMIGIIMKEEEKVEEKEEEVDEEGSKVVIMEEQAWESQEEDEIKPSIEEDNKVNAKPEVIEKMDSLPEKKRKFPIFLIIIILLAGSAGVVLFSRVMTNKGNTQLAPAPTPAPDIIEEPTPTLEPQLDRADLTIQVLNGTGEPGVAGEGKDYLEGLGYEDVAAGNADSYNYKETGIALKEEAQEYFDLLSKDLAGMYSVSSESSTLSESSDYDVVVTLGLTTE